jgi:hypothetical protein
MHFYLHLNPKQAKGLADSSLDIAKGLILGSAGSGFIASAKVRVAIVFANTILATFFVRLALKLLEKPEWQSTKLV